MTISVLIPHFRSKIISYSIWKILQHKGNHDVEIVVVDNSFPDKSIEYVKIFGDAVRIIKPDTTRESSHGTAFNMAIPTIANDFFLCLESDAFPVKDGFLDYYERLINEGYDMAAPLLKLSGGTFFHPTGSLYSKKIWQEAQAYIDNISYTYFSNMMMIHGEFDYHLMIRNDWLEKVLDSPDDFFDLANGYKGKTKEEIKQKGEYYSSIGKGVMHNGIGSNQENIHTYGKRNVYDEAQYAILDNRQVLIRRVGEEPGQYFSAWAVANGKKIYSIPEQTKWLPGKENQQQQYTILESGIVHAWAGSAYLSMKDTAAHDVYEYKQKQIDDLYDSLPNEYKL